MGGAFSILLLIIAGENKVETKTTDNKTFTPTSLLNFDFNGKDVRVIKKDGEPWFVGKDVCAAIGTRTKDIPQILDEDEKGVDTIDTLGGEQAMTVISESGLYSLMLRSRKPEAKVFKKWITREVLPSIRKTGAYLTDDTLDKVIEDPDFALNLVKKLQKLKVERDTALRQRSLISDKKTATAMARVGHANSKVKKLEEEVGIYRAVLAPLDTYVGVRDIPWISMLFKDFDCHLPASYIGTDLSKLSQKTGYPIIEFAGIGASNLYNPVVVQMYGLKVLTQDVRPVVKQYLK